MNRQDENIDIWFNMTMDRLKSQIGRIDGMDSKIGITFGLANGVLIALLGVFAGKSLSVATQLLGVASIAAYIVTLGLLMRAYATSHWDYRPNLSDLNKICSDHQYNGHTAIVKKWIADECLTAYKTNKTKIARKGQAASQALYSLGGQAILFALAGVAHVIS